MSLLSLEASPAAKGRMRMTNHEDDLAAAALQLAARIEAQLAKGQVEHLTPAAIQALMSALCRTYTAQCELGSVDLPLAPDAPTNATDVMMTTSGLLRSADISAFEFAMWQSWGGR